MTAGEIIARKRDGGVLSDDEIARFIRGYMSGEIADYQATALLMAIFLRGMTADEVFALTREMRDSGSVLNLSGIVGSKIDKHSTGGVGDKTSLLLAPIAASCGVVVPMITGRALGHAGGTLDKLEAIPGFDIQPSNAAIMKSLASVKAVIMGQTDELAPADRRLYALRDVTATVESIPLITASILSKKLAEGIDGLVMDITTGGGAYMATMEQATELARSINNVCRRMKIDVVCLITEMSEPRGRAIGNALEVRECIEFLHGKAAEDLETVTLALAAQMLRLGKKARTVAEGMKLAYEAVSQGRALSAFKDILKAQGADPAIVDDPDRLPRADHVTSVRAEQAGRLIKADAKLLGTASNALGAGRLRVTDRVDPAVGLYLHKKVGDSVARGEVLCDVHWNEEGRFKNAMPLIRQAFAIGGVTRDKPPLIHAVLEG